MIDDTFAAIGPQLIEMRNRIATALQFNYELGLIRKRELNQNLNKLTAHAIPKLCGKYGMDKAVSKLEEINEEIMGGCTFNNSYIRAMDNERIAEMYDNLNRNRETITLRIRYNEEKAREAEREFDVNIYNLLRVQV